MKFNPESDHWHWYERKCPSCPPEKGWQDLSNFYNCAARPNGKTSACKSCCKKRTREYKIKQAIYETRRTIAA